MIPGCRKLTQLGRTCSTNLLYGSSSSLTHPAAWVKSSLRSFYAHVAKVYIDARCKEMARQVVGEIRAKFPASKGELVYLHLDLEDLFAIKESAEEFLGKEGRLDVL